LTFISKTWRAGAKPYAPFADPVKAASEEPNETSMQKFHHESTGPLDLKRRLQLILVFRTNVRTISWKLSKQAGNREIRKLNQPDSEGVHDQLSNVT